jgi:hypothetical protein
MCELDFKLRVAAYKMLLKWSASKVVWYQLQLSVSYSPKSFLTDSGRLQVARDVASGWLRLTSRCLLIEKYYFLPVTLFYTLNLVEMLFRTETWYTKACKSVGWYQSKHVLLKFRNMAFNLLFLFMISKLNVVDWLWWSETDVSELQPLLGLLFFPGWLWSERGNCSVYRNGRTCTVDTAQSINLVSFSMLVWARHEK